MDSSSEKSGVRRFTVGNYYSRNDIFSILEVPPEKTTGGNRFTGYTNYGGENYLFVNIMTSGRTGHNYNDCWVDDKTLFWHGKTNSHINQPSIQNMIAPDSIVHIFTRTNSSDVNFTYQGIGKAIKINDTVPVEITWKL
ncbi:MAG: DUF3427 domain-containing protein [Clostridia bacterium]|nr:DUF3427 domain-containing protein [Clostridia bacterium]